MASPAHQSDRYHQNSVEQDEISPSITIRRSRRMRTGQTAGASLVYTEQLWAPTNNTLVGCTEYAAWQTSAQWLIITDAAHQGEAGASASFMATARSSQSNLPGTQ